MIAGSFAFPEHTWKKHIIFITKNTMDIMPAAMGAMKVQQRIPAQIHIRRFTTVNLSTCLTWNIVYFDE